MTRLALDASALIYLVEGTPPVRERVLEHLEPILKDPEGQLVACRLARLECRVRPLRDGDSGLLASYEAIFSARRFVFVELTDAVVERATALRACHGFKTPDALHLAAALEARADVFLTGDAQLTRCSALRVTVVAP